MAGNTIVAVGKSIPIALQLGDPADDQYPQVYIFDNTNTFLTTLDLVHIGAGLYRADYVMPDKVFITVTYIVFSDVAHANLNTKYQLDIDTFTKIVEDDYKATGFAPSGEYDALLGTIAGDVDGLNGEGMRGTNGANTVVPDAAGTVPTNPLLTNDARLNNLDAAISTRADENPPSQVLADYKATGFAVANEYDDQLNRILGLTQENQYIDNTTYDEGKMTSGRLRTYSVAGSVGTPNDVIATYTITVTYSGSDMVTYSMVKV